MAFLKKTYRPCQNYPKPIPVRATPEEKEKIQALAKECGVSVSRYLVRRATEEKPPLTHEEREEFLLLLTQLRMIGTNLHLLSRTINTRSARGGTNSLSVQELKSVVSAVKVTTQSIRRRL